MAKEAPTMTLTVDDAGGTGRAISNDCTNLSIATPRAVFEVTGINSAAVERLLGVADGSISMNGVFNSASALSHDVFKDAGSTAVARTVLVLMSGQLLTMEGLLSEYVVNRAADASLTWAVTAQQTTTTGPAWTTP